MSRKLLWSHNCELIYINDKKEKDFYEKECINSGWFVRELKRQINTMYLNYFNSKINDKNDNILEYNEELLNEIEKILN